MLNFPRGATFLHPRPPALLRSSLRFEIFKRSPFSPRFFFSSSYDFGEFSSLSLFPLLPLAGSGQHHRSGWHVWRVGNNETRRVNRRRPSRVTSEIRSHFSLSASDRKRFKYYREGENAICSFSIHLLPFVSPLLSFFFLFWISRTEARDARLYFRSLRNSIYYETRAIPSHSQSIIGGILVPHLS